MTDIALWLPTVPTLLMSATCDDGCCVYIAANSDNMFVPYSDDSMHAVVLDLPPTVKHNKLLIQLHLCLSCGSESLATLSPYSPYTIVVHFELVGPLYWLPRIGRDGVRRVWAKGSRSAA